MTLQYNKLHILFFHVVRLRIDIKISFNRVIKILISLTPLDKNV